MVAGLTPSSGGSITINGKDVDGPYGDYGFVFQAPSLMPWRTVLQNVLFPMDVLKRNDSAALQRARELLALVGLSDFAASRPHQLSGGMQQRVALCRALIHAPKLLLMDEPFGALDELTRLEMNDLLLKIRKETQASVLFVTHSISEAVYLADKVLVFSGIHLISEFFCSIPKNLLIVVRCIFGLLLFLCSASTVACCWC